MVKSKNSDRSTTAFTSMKLYLLMLEVRFILELQKQTHQIIWFSRTDTGNNGKSNLEVLLALKVSVNTMLLELCFFYSAKLPSNMLNQQQRAASPGTALKTWWGLNPIPGCSAFTATHGTAHLSSWMLGRTGGRHNCSGARTWVTTPHVALLHPRDSLQQTCQWSCSWGHTLPSSRKTSQRGKCPPTSLFKLVELHMHGSRAGNVTMGISPRKAVLRGWKAVNDSFLAVTSSSRTDAPGAGCLFTV